MLRALKLSSWVVHCLHCPLSDASPDVEGIETAIGSQSCAKHLSDASPDVEGIETCACSRFPLPIDQSDSQVKIRATKIADLSHRFLISSQMCGPMLRSTNVNYLVQFRLNIWILLSIFRSLKLDNSCPHFEPVWRMHRLMLRARDKIGTPVPIWA